MGRASRLVLVLVGALIFSSCVLFCDGQTEKEKMKIQIEPIFVALEEYKNNHKQYPGRLEDLVPMYLSDYRIYLKDYIAWEYMPYGLDDKYDAYFFNYEYEYCDGYVGGMKGKGPSITCSFPIIAGPSKLDLDRPIIIE